MGKYFPELNELITLGEQAFSDDFITDEITPLYNDYFTADVFAKFLKLFNKHYYYLEVAHETPEMFRHYVEQTFLENIDEFMIQLEMLERDTKSLATNKIEIISENIDSDFPQDNVPLVDQYISRQQKGSIDQILENDQEINLIENYLSKRKNYIMEFVKKFRDCFLYIY